MGMCLVSCLQVILVMSIERCPLDAPMQQPPAAGVAVPCMNAQMLLFVRRRPVLGAAVSSISRAAQHFLEVDVLIDPIIASNLCL